MEKLHTLLTSLIIAAFMAASFGLHSETITSTQDGDWNAGTTWTGGNIPTSADSVVVQHLLNIYNEDSCMHLYVAPSGILRNRINYSSTLVILGNLYVDGVVKYNNNYFYIKLGGNLHLNGIWDSPKVEFTGSTEQIVSAAPGKVFEATRTAIEFEDINPASPLKFATDLSFIDIALLMNSTTVEFAPGIQVTLSEEELLDANIIGNNSVLMMHDGSYAQGCMFDNLTFKGVFIIGNGNTASGELINADTLQNLINGSRTLEVFGNFTNHGMIRETNNHFNFIIHGDVANSGFWVSSDVSFNGDISNSGSWVSLNVYFDSATDQHVNFDPGTHIFCANIEDRDVNSKIILDTDWEIHNANVDLNNGILEVSGHKVTLRETAFIEEAFIDEAVLGGVFNCLLNCVFTGTTTISDTLQNHGNYSTPEVVFEGNLINNGVIRRSYSSNSYGLRIFIHTDFEVNGPVEIEDLTFAGVNNQNIFSTTKGAVIEVDDVFNTVAASSIIVNSDFTFIGSTWDLDGATINLNNGNLTMQGGNLKNGSLTTSNKYLRQSGGAAIWNMHLSNVELKGICQLFANDNLFTNVTNTDTLRNYSAYNSNVKLSADGNFVNNGVINRGNYYAIQLYIHNDFIINGPVDIEDLVFAGINDQTIYSTSKGGIIDVDQVYDTVASSAIILNTDMTFFIENFWDLDGASINLNNGSLIMQGGDLKNGSLTTNNKYLRQTGGAAIINMHLSNVELKGICQVFGSDMLFTNVTNTDTLRNYPGYNSNVKLLAEGNFVNNGVINRGNNYGLQLYVYNDFIINGPIDIEDLFFAGNNDQTIYSTSKGGIIDVDQVYDTVASSAIIFNSDMTFIGSNWYLDGASINLTNGNLIMQGGKLANGFLTSNNQYLRQSGNAGISEMHFSNVELKGICKLSSANSYFTNVTVTDTLMNHQDYNTYPKLFVDGDFVNNGVITNSDNYWIDLRVDGNYYNNGKANYEQIVFTGDDIQYFYSPVFPISNSDIESTKTGGLVQCDGDVLLDTCIVYFNWDVFSLQNGDLKVTGGDLKRVGIKGNGFKLISNGNGATANVAFEDLTIEGHLHMGGVDNSFDDVTLSDTISQHGGHNYDTHISTTGDFINNGHIIDIDNYDLWFYVQDVLINNGDWKTEKLVFDGDDMHYIESLEANPFEVDFITMGAKGGDVSITSELYLLNTDVNLSSQNLYIPDAGILDIDSSAIQNAMVYGGDFSSMNCSNNSWFSASTFNNILISGTVDTRANTFTDCVLEAVMQNDEYNIHPTIVFDGNFTNSGSIINRPGYSYDLYNDVFGNVYNYGIWEIDESSWQGLFDQDIYLMDASEINTPSEFQAVIGTGGTYQWYKNDSVIAGATANHLDFAAITADERGYYHCTTNEGTSRTIRICTAIEIDLADEAYFCQYESVMIEATPTSGEGSYTYSWTPTEGLSDPNIANPIANPSEPTVYFCTITDAIGCKGEASIFVQQYPQLYVDAGDDEEICYNDNIILPGNATGGDLDYDYVWTPADGLTNPNIANPSASPDETTNYTLTVTDGNGCVESDQVIITVHPLPTFSYETSDTVVCYGEEITYTEYFTGTAPWTVDGFLNGLPDTFTTYDNPAYFTIVPTESFFWEPLTVTDGNGCTSPVNQPVNVTVHPLPTFTYEFSDTEVCFGEEITFTNYFTGTAPWTVEFMYNGIYSSFTTSENPEYFIEIFDETTVYEPLSVSDATGCSSEVNQPNTFIVNPKPVAYQLTSAGPYCWEVPTTMHVAGSEVGVIYYLIRDGNPPEFMMEGTGSPIEFNFILGEGTYTVKGVNTITDCENMMTGSIVVEIDYAPIIVAQMGDDHRLIGTSKTWIAETSGTDPLTYNWYFDGDLVQSGPSNTYTKTNLTLDDTGEYWFVVENHCGEEQSESMYFTVLDEQSVTIPAGWSGISTYLSVWDDEVDKIFQYIQSDLIVVNDFEHMYWPGQNINTYADGKWDTYTGAQIKLSAPATVDFQGLHLDDFIVDLNETWTYIPVLHQTPVPADELFMQAPDQIVIAKDIAGTGVYWPQYEINTLDILNPNMAYFVKVTEATEVDFGLITKSGTVGSKNFRPQNITPWNNPVYSNNSHTIALPKDVAISELMPGDWIGVFNAEDVCCGIVEFDGNSTAISAFGNDNTTYETDGLLESEWMSFKAYRPSSGETYDLIVEFNASANESGYFRANGMSVISGLKAEATGLGDNSQSRIRIYPNPTNGLVFIEGISVDSQIEITNAAGQVVYETDAIGKQSIDLGTQARGLYSIRITNQKFTSTHKVMVE